MISVLLFPPAVAAAAMRRLMLRESCFSRRPGQNGSLSGYRICCTGRPKSFALFLRASSGNGASLEDSIPNSGLPGIPAFHLSGTADLSSFFTVAGYRRGISCQGVYFAAMVCSGIAGHQAYKIPKGAEFDRRQYLKTMLVNFRPVIATSTLAYIVRTERYLSSIFPVSKCWCCSRSLLHPR